MQGGSKAFDNSIRNLVNNPVRTPTRSTFTSPITLASEGSRSLGSLRGFQEIDAVYHQNQQFAQQEHFARITPVLQSALRKSSGGSGTQYVSTAGAALRGVGTGVKALVNGAASTAVSFLTLGSKSYDGPWGVTQFDRDVGYDASNIAARVSGEIVTGLATGGLSQLSRAGTAARIVSKGALTYDTTGNALSAGRGAVDAYQNGWNAHNAVQFVGGGLGFGGNVAAGGQALREIVSDAGRVRIRLDYDALRSQQFNAGAPLNAIKVSLAPKVHLKTNTAVGNFGVYDINVNGLLHKIGKADLDRITQSSGLPTRVHRQIRVLEKYLAREVCAWARSPLWEG